MLLLLPAFCAIALAIPINITTFNYISYDVSQYFYVSSNSKNIDLGINIDPHYLQLVAQQQQQLESFLYSKVSSDSFDGSLNNFNQMESTMDFKNLLLLSDSKLVKLNHDYNNVLYCLIKYLKGLTFRGKKNKLMSLDNDLMNFIKINRSTDEFIENVIKNKADVKRILNSLSNTKHNLFDPQDDGQIVNEILANHQQYPAHDSFSGSSSNIIASSLLAPENSLFLSRRVANTTKRPVKISLIHLYHLTPIVDDTFQYQIFHKLNFNYPDIDASINNTLKFLRGDSFFKSLLELINELTNRDIQIQFSPSKKGSKNIFANIQILSRELKNETPKITSSINLTDIKFQLNVLIVINLTFVIMKVSEAVSRGRLSFRSIMYFS